MESTHLTRYGHVNVQKYQAHVLESSYKKAPQIFIVHRLAESVHIRSQISENDIVHSWTYD